MYHRSTLYQSWHCILSSRNRAHLFPNHRWHSWHLDSTIFQLGYHLFRSKCAWTSNTMGIEDRTYLSIARTDYNGHHRTMYCLKICHCTSWSYILHIFESFLPKSSTFSCYTKDTLFHRCKCCTSSGWECHQFESMTGDAVEGYEEYQLYHKSNLNSFDRLS
jgi:hypothetical protein